MSDSAEANASKGRHNSRSGSWSCSSSATSRVSVGSASSPSSSSSSSGAYTSSNNADVAALKHSDEEHILQLTWVDVLGTLATDVQPEPEPVVESGRHPVLAIDYTPNFAFVTGLYRTLRPSMVELVRTPRSTLRPLLYAAAAPSPAMARWLALTAYTIRQCSSHYTAWSDRREIVLNPYAFWAATRDRVALGSPALPADIAMAEDVRQSLAENYADMAFRFKEVARTWLPDAGDMPADAITHLGGGAAGGAASDPVAEERAEVKALWHGIAWELEAVGPIGRLYHKNFQVWHHRKELLLHGLSRTVDVQLLRQGQSRTDAAARTVALAALLSSKEVFAAVLRNDYGLEFSQIDERTITGQVLEFVDSKNYHVWIHRSVIVHALTFLTRGPPASRWRSDWLGLCGIPTGEASPAGSDEFFVDPHWVDENAVILAIPVPTSAPIKDEFDFTARAINVDCFNNSAWCHRVQLLRDDVVGALLRQHAAAVRSRCPGGEGTEHLSQSELMHVLWTVCKKETDFALQWCFLRPSNQCGFDYARTVAEVYQATVQRVLLHAAMARAGAALADIDVLLTTAVRGPVAAACMAGYVSEDAVAAGEGAEEEAVFRLLCTVREYLPWAEYISTFDMLHYQLGALHKTLRPLVGRIGDDVNTLLRRLSTAGESAADADELQAVRRERLELVHEAGTQFMFDNYHQTNAAMFQACFAFLEQTWLIYWGTDKRAAVAATRTPEQYARDGITDDLLPAEALRRTLAEWRGVDEVTFFLDSEAMALQLAKRLTLEDPVRVKYWAHEARTVLCREY